MCAIDNCSHPICLPKVQTYKYAHQLGVWCELAFSTHSYVKEKETKEKSIYSRSFCLISVYINNVRLLLCYGMNFNTRPGVKYRYSLRIWD